MNLRILEERINNAIDVRESGELKKSRPLFESILKDVNILLQKDSSKELKNIYATAMGQYVIQYRLEAAELYKKALKMGRQLLEYDRKNEIRNPLSIRSVSNTLINLGAHEQAEEFLRDLIPLYKTDSAKLGDTKVHLALCLLRTGRIREAGKLVDEAIEDIRLNTADDKYASNRMSGSLIVKALILNAERKVSVALEFAQEALVVAKENNNVFRITQTQEIIKFLERKLKDNSLSSAKEHFLPENMAPG